MKLKTLLFLAMFALSASVWAGSGTGTITNPTAQSGVYNPTGGRTSGQLFFFGTSSTVLGDCNTDHRFAVDVTSSGGAATMKVVLAAYALGKSVTVIGTGNCVLFSTSEDAASVVIGP